MVQRNIYLTKFTAAATAKVDQQKYYLMLLVAIQYMVLQVLFRDQLFSLYLKLSINKTKVGTVQLL